MWMVKWVQRGRWGRRVVVEIRGEPVGAYMPACCRECLPIIEDLSLEEKGSADWVNGERGCVVDVG